MSKKKKEHTLDEEKLDRKIKSGQITPVHIPKIASTSDIVKYQFCSLIIKYKKDMNLKQKDIGEILNINKSEVSKLFSYNLKEFSQERIFSFIDTLTTSGADLDIVEAWNSIKKQSTKLNLKLRKKSNSKKIRA